MGDTANAMDKPEQVCLCKKCKCENCECKVLRRLLLPIDSTGEDVEVINWVIDNVHRDGDLIILLHVIPARFPKYAWGMYDDSFVEVPDPKEEKIWREDCAKYVAATISPILEKKKVSFKLDIVAYETNNTSIGDIICEKANILNADCVIMASHQKGRFKEFFVGSVTNYCLHHSKIPLIVWKPPPPNEEKKVDDDEKETTKKVDDDEKETTKSVDFEKVNLEEK